VPALSSYQNDLERPVMNSARPVFSDSMFIIPEQNFKLLPPRTSAKMRRYFEIFSLGGLMIAIFMLSKNNLQAKRKRVVLKVLKETQKRL
jgi:hypothetical protein